ncbi:hypothetical protein HAHE_30190 [Haloferula helveola]|uniref:Uncharacterized protein n=1 Tax=Haloferula helveola TaxID=490095 RepID=A0ABM7RBU5_9BACT|nr:hypothetical protein HAHE_30190 [Haloferula helveola]
MRTLILLAVAFLAKPLAAQDIAPKDSERDPVLTALLEGSEIAPENAVTLDLNEAPVLVTGNPPIDVDLMEDPELASPDPGGVRVEIEGGDTNSHFAAKDIKLVAPFPAKPLSSPPKGWRLIHPESAPAISEQVSLANGSKIRLSIRPHVLVPDADGSQVFALSEPGFDPTLGYAQTETVGAVLADTIHDLDRNGDRLDAAARRLAELLDSLPSPAVEVDAEDSAEPNPEAP